METFKLSVLFLILAITQIFGATYRQATTKKDSNEFKKKQNDAIGKLDRDLKRQHTEYENAAKSLKSTKNQIIHVLNNQWNDGEQRRLSAQKRMCAEGLSELKPKALQHLECLETSQKKSTEKIFQMKKDMLDIFFGYESQVTTYQREVAKYLETKDTAALDQLVERVEGDRTYRGRIETIMRESKTLLESAKLEGQACREKYVAAFDEAKNKCGETMMEEEEQTSNRSKEELNPSNPEVGHDGNYEN